MDNILSIIFERQVRNLAEYPETKPRPANHRVNLRMSNEQKMIQNQALHPENWTFHKFHFLLFTGNTPHLRIPLTHKGSVDVALAQTNRGCL